MSVFEPLLQALRHHDLLPGRSLSDAAVQESLRFLASLLSTCVRSLSRDDTRTLAPPGWSKAQLDFMFATAQAVLSECSDQPLEAGVTELVEKIAQLIVQLCIRALENFTTRLKSTGRSFAADIEVFDWFLLLLELAVGGEGTKERGPNVLNSTDYIIPEFGLLEIDNIGLQELFHSHGTKCEMEGPLLEETAVEISDDILALLASDKFVVDDDLARRSRKSHAAKQGKNVISAAQHFAVVHFSCHKRLIDVCKEMLPELKLDSPLSKEEIQQLQVRISLAARILKLLADLLNSYDNIPSGKEFGIAIIMLAARLPALLKYNCRYERDEDAEYQGILLSTLLSSFFCLIEVTFQDDCIIQNLRTFIAAWILDILDVKQDKPLGSREVILHFIPEIISFFLGLVKGIHSYSYPAHLTRNKVGLADINLPVCQLRSQPFHLNEFRSQEDCLQIIFPSDGNWLDKLLGIIGYLYVKGMDLRKQIEKLHQKEGLASSQADHVVANTEDDALFGNLFSESGRHSPKSEGCSQSSLTEKKLSGPHSLPFQTVFDMLSFLKNCVFSSNWQRLIFESACRQLNRNHVDVLLQINLCEKEKMSSVFDISDSSDILIHLVNLSFYLLHSLVAKHILPPNLEGHLFSQILERGSSGCTFSHNFLTLLAKILINRSSFFDKDQDDLPQLQLWGNFIDTTALRAQSVSWLDMPVQKACTSLPSLFHMQVLLMAFHSLQVSGRISIMQRLVSTVIHLCSGTSDLSGSQLTLKSLLLSRLIMVLRYAFLHFRAFPRWLLEHVRNRLKNSSQEIMTFSELKISPIYFWTAITAESIKEVGLYGEDLAICEQFSVQLFDVSGFFSNKDIDNLVDLNDSQWEALRLCHCICSLLESWRGKPVKGVDELFAERYVFFLGWTIVKDIRAKIMPALPWDLPCQGFTPFTVDFFVKVSQGISGPFDIDGTKDPYYSAGSLLDALSCCIAVLSDKEAVDLGTWNLLRLGSVLNLLFSLLQLSFTKIIVQGGLVSEDGTGSALEIPALCELLEDHFLDVLFRNLLSLLQFYVDSYRDCLLNTFSDQHLCQSTVSSISLLLQSGLSRSKLEELFAILGVSFPFLQSILRFGDPTSWSEQIFSRIGEAGYVISPINRLFAAALLHGYPSCSHPASASVISCTMIIEGILETIILAWKARILASNLNKQGCEQEKLCLDLFKKVTPINFNSSFETMHPRCDELRNLLLSSKEEQVKCNDLCLLKQQESILISLSSGGNANELVRDELVICVVDAINGFFRDAGRVITLKEHFVLGHQQLFLLVDVLEGCNQETVNLKVLQLLADLIEHAGLRTELQEKFLSMNITSLSFWLMQKLLGCKLDLMEGVLSVNVVSNSVRELAMNFLSSLVFPVLTSNKKDIRNHILNALLLNLEEAYSSFDISSFKAYFTFLVQIANREPQLRLVVKSVLELLEKLPKQGSCLEGLKFLISFLSSVLSACGVQKVQAQHKVVEGRHWPTSITASRVGIAGRTKHVVLKNSELLTAVEQSGNITTADCDATSADEDDDGTSDGEITILDKDEDDEGNCSEKVLASRVCTFTSSGSNYMEQHWYFCYTCDLTVTKGCCSICARVCHRGHKVVYSRLSRFFCDCGAGGVRGMSCLCLKPRKYVSPSSTVSSTGASVSESLLPLADDQDHALPTDSDSDIDDETCHDIERSHKILIDEGEDKLLFSLLSDLEIEGHLLFLSDRILNSMVLDKMICKDEEIHLGEDKTLIIENDLLQLKRVYKTGSFDMKIKTDYPNARELRSQLATGSLVKSLLSVSSRGRLAVGEGDKVAIYDVGQLIGQPGTSPITVDKTTVKPLSVKNPVRFEVVQLIFNSINESYLAVAGYEDCQIFTVNPRGEVIDRLAIELALQDAYIRRVAWVPGSQVQLMVVTNKFVKIYGLSQDNISPIHYFTVFEDFIADATVVSGRGQLMLIVLSQQGLLYLQRLSEKTDSRPRILVDTIQLPVKYQISRGVSIYFSLQHRLLFVSYTEGLCLIGRLNPEATSFTEISSVLEVDQDGKTKMAGLRYWKEAFDDNGSFVCLSNSKSSSVAGICVGPSKLQAQHLRLAGGSGTPRVDGFITYRTMTRERNNLLILYDDGSLQVFSFSSHGCDKDGQNARQRSSIETEQLRKWGAALLDNRLSSSVTPVFPLDFFEKTTCITTDIKLGGDILHSGDPEAAKLSLATEDGFLEAPSPTGLKIIVFNSNPDTVMVGCRVHVGNTAASHIPSEICIFQRSIKLEEGVRCWYDIPFTNTEALLADEQFTLTIGPTFNGYSLPRIDCLEVYGRSKDDFGWKEKLDTVLDMEARNSGRGTSTVGAKQKNLQNTSLPEQILADTFRLLSGYYVAFRTCMISDINEERFDLSRQRCQRLLEMVFENDRHPYLQGAARRLLRALHPSKETYYMAKDTMRLAAISRVCKLLEAKVQVGGCITACAIKDFISQMRAVCKISLHRRSNLTCFLERHGPSVIEDIMKVLWEILLVEQLDAQTINNLVIPAVDLIYGYAECLVSNANNKAASGTSVAPAVAMCKRLLFAPSEAVRTFSSLAMSSRLLEVPFPKQTILAIDDIADSSSVTSLPPESGVTTQSSGHALMEDDGSTASVQYCCDGCSTVPIINRRWHCNICPDFDLCEACYQVMDSDRLPPPHSKDHPMSAIPIEAESLGGERHFSSMDELSDESLLQVASEISLQSTSARMSSTLDATECENFMRNASSESKAVTISASKRAVNYLLISKLLEETRGWMPLTSGMHAISFMQLLYRLASAPSGPFVDASFSESLDLRSLIVLMLEEMNLSIPLSAKLRSSFGEIVILAFTFFNLMLRNWHQPTSDHSHAKSGVEILSNGTPASSGSGSPSSYDSRDRDTAVQLDRACAVLRQQQLVNYLFSIIQQLAHVFKSSSRSWESIPSCASSPACGALLTVRKEFAAGSFSPFFSDAYAKSHRGDLFEDFYRLLLESAFRLTYSIVRPEKIERPNEREQSCCKAPTVSDLKLDGWQELLCTFINNPHTTSIRKYARRLLLHLCGTKGYYYSVRDAWQLSKEVKRLYKLIQKSEALQGLISYEKTVKVVKCLLAIVEVASARPRNWQKYCSRQTDLLQFLLKVIFHFEEESAVPMLKLLALAFYSGKVMVTPSTTKADQGGPSSVVVASNTSSSLKTSGETEGRKKSKGAGEDVSDTVSEKTFLDMEAGAEQFAADEGAILRRFIDVFLLEWNATSVRSEAKNVLYGAWHHGRDATRALILTSLMQKVPVLPSFGQNIVEYTHLLTWILGKGVSESSAKETELVRSCLTVDVVKGVFETLRAQNQLLANHPNSRIYNTLSSLVEFDGYYLESEPCLACSCPEVPYTRMKLESLKSETKFTDNRILVKCIGSHTIQSVTMNVHEPRSKTVRILNLYYNNKPVSDLSELKNNRSLWKKVKSCHLGFNQTELKVEFPIPITACNLMIELDSFYENLQASSLESLLCPRCSRNVTDKHGICSNCHENAYQCRQCRNINYENLDSFLCNECGFSKYGKFEFIFMAKPSFNFDAMESDEDMKKGLSAIEAESENAHRRYQQLLGFKKPLLKLVSSIGESEMDAQQKDSVQQMIVSLPGSSSFKINRKIAILGVLYGEKCKMAFDSVSRSVQTLQGLRRVLTNYLERKRNSRMLLERSIAPRPSNRCYGCANTFVSHCLEWLQVSARMPCCKQQVIEAGILLELFENNIHQGTKSVRIQSRAVLSILSESDATAVAQLNNLIKQKTIYCLDHHRSMDIAACVREELQLLSETCMLSDEFWEARLRLVFQLLFSSIKVGAHHPAIAEHIILPCLKIIAQACTPPKSEASILSNSEASIGELANPPPGVKPEIRLEENSKVSNNIQRSNNLSVPKAQFGTEKDIEQDSRGHDVPLVNYAEWKSGATYLDFVRRQYTISQNIKPVVQKSKRDSKRADFLALKYMLRWKRRACKLSVTNEFAAFEESSWVRELVLSACSQAIRVEICGLIGILCSRSPCRCSKFLNLLMTILPATRSAGESAAEYFELLYKMIEPEDARLYLTVRGFLSTLCRLISEEVARLEAQEHSFHIDLSQGYILHKLIELLQKFLQVSNVRARFMNEGLLTQTLDAFVVIKGLVVHKTKLISDCGQLLKELLDSLLQESYENKRHFVRACIAGFQTHAKSKKDRSFVFLLEQLCNIICPTKPDSVYQMVLNKAHTQEEFIRGSMTKNPYSSADVGPLMRDVKNKICLQLDLLGLLEDDYGMELLVAGNIISLDLSVAQVYEQVWKKAQNQTSGAAGTTGLSLPGATSGRECPPMIITYRLQGLDGEATEPMIKELEDDREESQDPEVEFAISGVMRECNGLKIVLDMVQAVTEEEIKSNHEELVLILRLLMYCCKIRQNRQALLCLGALGVLLDKARRAFSFDAIEPAEGLLLIVESLVTEAIESDIGAAELSLAVSKGTEGAGDQAAHAVLMFLERLSYSSTMRKSGKQQRNSDMVARILPYLTYGEQAAIEVLVDHFDPYLHNWGAFDELIKKHRENVKDECLARQAAAHQLTLENFVKVTESIKANAHGDKIKSLIVEKGIPTVAVRYLKEVFSVYESGCDYKGTVEWACGLELPSVPIILSILRGLSRGHLATQRCLDDEGLLPLLHALESVSGENEIGARAENLLDTLADKEGRGEGFLVEKVLSLRHATRNEMRRRALRKREELLQGLGMRRESMSGGGERIVVSKPPIEGLEEVEEEQAGLACMVCREGYSLRPKDMLGTYCYSKRVNLGLGPTSNARAEWVYTTVSHFNIIHFQCHQEAKRADASLKNPKKEWDGATLRNNETLCNNLFPLRGPSIPLSQYARCVDQYWDNLNALGRADGSRLRLLTYDIVLMLARFATGASFSADSKGGGKESNSRLLPFMVQMAQHLLDQGGSSQCRIQAKALSAYLALPLSPESPGSGSRSSSPSTVQRLGVVDETVQFMMVQSLLLESLQEWQQHRRIFLQRGIYNAYQQYKHGRTSLPTSTLPSPIPSPRSTVDVTNIGLTNVIEKERDDTNANYMEKEYIFTVVQPTLVYTGLVNQLQSYLKHGDPRVKDQVELAGDTFMEEGSLRHGDLESWEVIMKERLKDIKVLLGFSKELLEWLDEMQGATDFQEAFDIMGALGDVLSCNFSNCEDFVWDAVSNGFQK